MFEHINKLVFQNNLIEKAKNLISEDLKKPDFSIYLTNVGLIVESYSEEFKFQYVIEIGFKKNGNHFGYYRFLFDENFYLTNKKFIYLD